MLNPETIVNAVKEIQESTGAGATAPDIKRILAAPQAYSIKEEMKICVKMRYLDAEGAGTGRNIYTITDVGVNRLNNVPHLVQEIGDITYEGKQKQLSLGGGLTGLSAVAGVITENEMLERKLINIRTQLSKLLGEQDDGEATGNQRDNEATA